MSDTTEMEKLRILTMWECGKSTTEIAKAVNKSARTVQRWLAHQKKEGNMDRKARGLRPRKTTAEQDANIYKLVRENPELTQKEIQTICNVDIYKGTLRRRIQEAKGIFKIDLFPKEKAKKKRLYPKKKKVLEETTQAVANEVNIDVDVDIDLDVDDEVKIDDNDDQLKVPLLLTDANLSEDANVVTVTSERLLETLLSPVHEMHVDDINIRTLPYEDGADFNDDHHFEDAYEVDMNTDMNITPNVSVNDSDDDIFTMADPVKPDFVDLTQFETFVSCRGEDRESDEVVKIELLDASQLDEDVEETLEMHVEEAPAPIPAARKRRVRKPKHQTIFDLDVDANDNEAVLETAQEVEVKAKVKVEGKGRKRRMKCVKDEPNVDAQEKKKKKSARRRGAERRVETRTEKRERIVREKIEWEKNRKDTTDIEKKKILIMAECGMTTEDIAKALKKSRRTVQRWLSKHNKGLDMDKKERGRRPRKTTPDQDASIIQLVKAHPNLSRREILDLAQVNLHKVTLKNRLNEAGMFFNSQGVKILDYTAQAQTEPAQRPAARVDREHDLYDYEHEHERLEQESRDCHVYDEHEHENALLNDEQEELEEQEATTIITCSSLTPTPAITNAILTSATRSTTLIITNSEMDNLQGVVTEPNDPTAAGGGAFHEFTLY